MLLESPHSPPLLGQHNLSTADADLETGAVCPTAASSSAVATAQDFISDEFYIDESLPSSLSIEAGQGEFVKQLDTANNVVALLQVF